MSKSVHSPPKRTGKELKSQRVTVLIPLRAAQRLSHIPSAVSPSDVTTPRPVITTLRFSMNALADDSSLAADKERHRYLRPATRKVSIRQGGSLAGMFLDVVDRLPDGLNLLSLLVGDRQFELVLKFHDQLDRV